MTRLAPLALLLATSLPALAQPAAPPAPAPGRPNPIQMFLDTDTNRDGRISWDEGWALVQTRFTAADADRNGGLTPEEFRALRPRRAVVPASVDQPPAADRMQRFVNAAFRAADANRDGQVSLDELRPMAEARFRALDANADNAVTPDELPSRGRGGPRRG